MGDWHDWTECDDIIALYVYKYGTAQIGLSHNAIAAEIGTTSDGLTMRVSNFRSLETGTGLSHVAQSTRSVRTHYGSLAEPELRAKAKNCLSME